jgi:putative transposase
MRNKQRPNQLDPDRAAARDSYLPIVPQQPSDSGQQELISMPSGEDVFGKDGLMARLVTGAIERMFAEAGGLRAEGGKIERQRTEYGRQGKRTGRLQMLTDNASPAFAGDREVRDASPVPKPVQPSTSELEEQIVNLYARGVSTRDIQETLRDIYSIEVTPTAISSITDKVWAQVETWQSRPLMAIYPIVYLDAIHLKLRRDGRVANTAVYIVLGVDLDGQRDVLGHWVGDGGEGANFWLSVVNDLQARGVYDIFIACVDGLPGFKAAIQAIFPCTYIQRCVIHQVRHSLAYVSWKDRKAFAADLQAIYGAPTREAAEMKLYRLSEKWSKTYAIAVRSWENSWEDLATMFDYAPDIRRLIYTTNLVEGYNGLIRRVIRNKGAFPNGEAVRKLLFLANRNITRTWTKPMMNWATMLNQLAIRFQDRFPS